MGFKKEVYEVEEKGLNPSEPHKKLGADGRLVVEKVENVILVNSNEDTEVTSSETAFVPAADLTAEETVEKEAAAKPSHKEKPTKKTVKNKRK